MKFYRGKGLVAFCSNHSYYSLTIDWSVINISIKILKILFSCKYKENLNYILSKFWIYIFPNNNESKKFHDPCPTPLMLSNNDELKKFCNPCSPHLSNNKISKNFIFHITHSFLIIKYQRNFVSHVSHAFLIINIKEISYLMSPTPI